MNIYLFDELEDVFDNDGITCGEEGFMKGYLSGAEPFTE